MRKLDTHPDEEVDGEHEEADTFAAARHLHAAPHAVCPRCASHLPARTLIRHTHLNYMPRIGPGDVSDAQHYTLRPQALPLYEC